MLRVVDDGPRSETEILLGRTLDELAVRELAAC